jgi:hypothetical protein
VSPVNRVTTVEPPLTERSGKTRTKPTTNAARFHRTEPDVTGHESRSELRQPDPAVLSELRQRDRWLLVIDNAAGPGQVVRMLPGGPGHVLITSRALGWEEVAVPVEVDVLARAESIALLANRVPGLAEADAGRVAQALGDLPLALAQVAGYMTGNGTSAGEYLALLAGRAGQVLAEGQLHPVAGQTYRIFVHVWNLGRFAAFGARLRAW